MKNLINTIVEPIVEPQDNVPVDSDVEMRMLELVVAFVPNEIDWALQPLIERYIKNDMSVTHLMVQMELYEFVRHFIKIKIMKNSFAYNIFFLHLGCSSIEWNFGWLD